jgi:hypothetical protein
MGEGKLLYFEQEDNLLGKVVYRLEFRKVSPGRLVFATENTSIVTSMFGTLFHPGEIQGLYILERESPGVWRYYGLFRTGRNASSLMVGHEASYRNRAAAFYRYLVGIPMDAEPPASP